MVKPTANSASPRRASVFPYKNIDMKELLRTTDLVQLSFLTELLKDHGICPFVLDNHMSVLEGSANAIPRRLMVSTTNYQKAKTIIKEFGEHIG